MAELETFLQLLFRQRGKPYVFGAEADPRDPDPPAFDCAEILQWASARLNCTPPLVDGTWRQAQQLRDLGLLIPVSAGVATRGALLFRFSSSPFGAERPAQAHVAVSLGDGRTFEARSSALGIGFFSAANRGWTHAGLIPGVSYAASSSSSAPSSAPLLLAALALGVWFFAKGA